MSPTALPTRRTKPLTDIELDWCRRNFRIFGVEIFRLMEATRTTRVKA